MLDFWDCGLVGEYLLERVGLAADVVAHGEKLSEGEALQVVLGCPTAEVCLAFFDVEHRGTGEAHVQVGEGIVDRFQFA